jgi:hypothetical protein
MKADWNIYEVVANQTMEKKYITKQRRKIMTFHPNSGTSFLASFSSTEFSSALSI